MLIAQAGVESTLFVNIKIDSGFHGTILCTACLHSVLLRSLMLHDRQNSLFKCRSETPASKAIPKDYQPLFRYCLVG